MCFVFFSSEMWNPNIPKKYKKKQISSEKQTKRSLTVRQVCIKHVWKISGPISHKRRGRWTLTGLGAISLNQPVWYSSSNFPRGRTSLPTAAPTASCTQPTLHTIVTCFRPVPPLKQTLKNFFGLAHTPLLIVSTSRTRSTIYGGT